MHWTVEMGLVSREMTDWIDGRYRGYLKGEVSEVAICGEMVQMYQRLHEDEMRRAAQMFFRDRIEQNIFPEMKVAGGRASQQRGGYLGGEFDEQLGN